MAKAKTKVGKVTGMKFLSHGRVAQKVHVSKTGQKMVFGKAKLSGGRIIKVSMIRSRLGISQVEMSRFIGYSTRAIADWETGEKPISPPARQKLTEAERLSLALERLIPRGEIASWLHAPNDAFEGQTPLQVIERGESDRLWQMIFQIESGVAN